MGSRRFSPVQLWLNVLAFVYFTHTTLLALALDTPTYADLWKHLGVIYTAHGVLMVVGGACVGWASLLAGGLPWWTATTFLLGLSINLLLALLPAPELLQRIGTAVRNAGLIGMGWAIGRGGVSRA